MSISNFIQPIWKSLGSIDNQLVDINGQLDGFNNIQSTAPRIPIFFLQDDQYNSSDRLGSVILMTLYVSPFGGISILSIPKSTYTVDLSDIAEGHNVVLRIPLHSIISNTASFMLASTAVGISFSNPAINDGVITNTIGSAVFVGATDTNPLIISGDIPTNSLLITCNNQSFIVGPDSDHQSTITIFGFQIMLIQTSDS